MLSLAIEEKEKKERGGQVILDLSALGDPITGIAQLPVLQEKLLLLISTPRRLHAFTGNDGLEALGSLYQTSPSKSYKLLLEAFPISHGSCRPSAFL